MSRMSPLPDGVEVLVCDIVGTLVDEVGTITSEVRRALEPHGVPQERAVSIARRWLDEFDDATRRIAAGDLPWRDDPALRSALLDDLLSAEDIDLPPAEFADLAQAGYRLAAWPGVPDQLDRLAAHVTVTGLTNASTDQIAAVSRRAGLRWHALFSTALVHTYKPAPAAYQLAIDQLALEPRRTLFLAAHPWDLRAAGTHGFRTAYLPRQHADRPSPEDHFDLVLDDLDDLVAVFGRF